MKNQTKMYSLNYLLGQQYIYLHLYTMYTVQNTCTAIVISYDIRKFALLLFQYVIESGSGYIGVV